MDTITLKIEGMSCGGCTSSVTNVLQAINGVSEVEVTLEPGQATIKYDADLASIDTFASAIEDAGFDVVK